MFTCKFDFFNAKQLYNLFQCLYYHYCHPAWKQWNIQYNKTDKDAMEASIKDITEGATKPEDKEYLTKNKSMQ